MNAPAKTPGLGPEHPDYVRLSAVEAAILDSAGGRKKFETDVPLLLRQAIDEVIDAPRTKRFTFADTEKTEKTYLGTKVEILLRNYLGLERGPRLDLLIGDEHVDVKNTVGANWTIPSEAKGHVCLLVRTNEDTGLCSVGLIVIHEKFLNEGTNRDGKTTIRAGALANVQWLLKDALYPPNFWLGLDDKVRKAIFTPRGGANRVAMLFRLHQRVPIPKKLVIDLAQQEDPMRRIRKNGGARDSLGLDGITILSGATQSARIRELGLPFCTPKEFISYS